ncbi:hypothetical protein LX97_03243 [Nonlabens dokdonensis]|uniref:Uncharacterized protein n=2 Tax=Nonlabens dokdonensis TaxID=328515 RepID=L7W9H9_NONDD|nr:hypothetical protein [Nonlabens dokdonensis]AGC76872.1 hypothetical protein DDD_1745 [Nonlabens dokdonensis DSW-6]PZX36781.1 hypothetical protein LX97_03243 [Nonlabens dokdonensis]
MTFVDKLFFEYKSNFLDFDHFGLLGESWDFEELAFSEQMKLLIERGILRNCSLNSKKKISGSDLKQENNVDKNSIDLCKTIVYNGSRYILNPVIKEEMWEEFYTSHSRHKFEERTKREIDSKIVRFQDNKERLQFLYDRMDSLDIFNLKNLEVEINNDSKDVYFWGVREHIMENFTSNRCFDYLTSMLGQYVEIYNDVEKQFSDDIAKFRVYKYLEKLSEEQLEKSEDKNEKLIIESIDVDQIKKGDFTTYQSIYLLDKLTALPALENSSLMKKDIYTIISKMIGRHTDNVKKAIKLLEKQPKEHTPAILRQQKIIDNLLTKGGL